jgi:mRNA interferase MazF
MVDEIFIPKKGDVVKLSFDPQSGHEQKGWRPGLVISNYTFNKATGFAVICPITNTKRDYPFHLEFPEDFSLTGVVMIEQAKSLDYINRKARYEAEVTKEFLAEAMALHQAIFQDD